MPSLYLYDTHHGTVLLPLFVVLFVRAQDFSEVFLSGGTRRNALFFSSGTRAWEEQLSTVEALFERFVLCCYFVISMRYFIINYLITSLIIVRKVEGARSVPKACETLSGAASTGTTTNSTAATSATLTWNLSRRSSEDIYYCCASIPSVCHICFLCLCLCVCLVFICLFVRILCSYFFVHFLFLVSYHHS